MEPLQPMRPVSVHHDEREEAPLWKVWGSYAGLAALYLISMWVDGGQRWAIVAGSCVFVVGAALSIAVARRISHDNANRRIPWIGLRPVMARKHDLLEGVGVPMTFLGALLVANNVPVPLHTSLPIIGFCFIGSIVAPQAWHNHRVRRSIFSNP